MNEEIMGMLGKILEKQTEMSVQISGLGEKVTRLDDRVGGLEEKVTRLDDRVGGLEEKVTRLDDRVGGLEEKVTRLDDRVGGLEEKVTRLDDRVGGLEEKANDLSRGVEKNRVLLEHNEEHVGLFGEGLLNIREQVEREFAGIHEALEEKADLLSTVIRTHSSELSRLRNESKHIQGILGEHEVALRILEAKFDEAADVRRA
ncbi:chromosome partition protein Smc [Peptococcaceae bacterium CEB3]|nr:chromosome partition protein Smc [Peptococcaceae bacterium CEB3]